MTEIALTLRLSELEERARALRSELSILEGRIRNRDAGRLSRAAAENAALEKELVALEERCFEALSGRAPTSEDAELLRKVAVDYFTQIDVSQDLWKSIAF